MKLGELLYNVEISRFLNPRDDEDRAYLVGQPPPPNNKFYLGVFMQIQNDVRDGRSRCRRTSGSVDTEGTEFKPIPSNSLFALKLGGKVAADGQLPEAGDHRGERPDPGVDGALPDRPSGARGSAR